jgi:hypothetical protein
MTKIFTVLGASALAFTVSLFTSVSAQSAHGHIHGIHRLPGNHPVHAADHLSISPYVCDTDEDLADNDMTSTFVLDDHHVALQVVSTVTESYCFDNAGGIINFPANLKLNSVSLFAKGDVNCSYGPWLNVIYIDPADQLTKIAFAEPCDGTVGPVLANGYRKVSWTGPNQTFVPNGATILALGINNDASNGPGTFLINSIFVNGIPVAADLHAATSISCPFPDPDCLGGGG